MISLAIGAVIGGTPFAAAAWRFRKLWLSSAARVAIGHAIIDEQQEELNALRSLQQPRLPNGRFKGKGK